jgi:hypothetical protein
MSIEVKDIEEEGFQATVYTLVCNKTGKSMANIIARDNDVNEALSHRINAEWAEGESGEYTIQGLLSYGPIEENGRSTVISDIDVQESGDSAKITLHVEELE